ncbi:hypothetical protein 7865G3D7_5 [Haloquadratum phage sp.]|jgi:hypothetical protein|nr:hypothetical protein 7865G3D7_5 [Haloquadratum phage sp.]
MSDTNDEEVDYRIFREGNNKSHIYIAGINRAICGCQTLRGYDSEDLPVLTLDDDIIDMCSNCAGTLWTHGLWRGRSDE